MEVSNDTLQPITEWVDFDSDPLKAIRCLASAINERISLIQGVYLSDNYVYISNFESLDYDVILKIRDSILTLLPYFCDLDFDDNHFSEYNTTDISFPKKVLLSDFSEETVRGFSALPCRGSIASAFKDFYNSCRTILSKMVAVEHSGDVITAKSRYYSNRYIGELAPESTSVESYRLEWKRLFDIFKEDTENFTKIVFGNHQDGEIAKKEQYFLCDVVSKKSLIDIIGICTSLSDMNSHLEDVSVYEFWNNIGKELYNRIQSPHKCANLSYINYAKNTINGFVEQHFSKEDSEYIAESLNIGYELKDGYSVENGYGRFTECLAQIEDPTIQEEGLAVKQEFEKCFNNASYTFYVTNIAENLSLFQKWLTDSANTNFESLQQVRLYEGWSVSNIFENLSRLSNMGAYLINNSFYFNNSLDFRLSKGRDSTELPVGELKYGWTEALNDDLFITRNFGYWGFLNPLKFTNFLEVAFVKAFSGFETEPWAYELRRDYLKILSVEQPCPNLNCKLRFRYMIAPKSNSSSYSFMSYESYRQPYKDARDIIEPINLPDNLTLGWHKADTVDWKPSLNVEFSSENWVPDGSEIETKMVRNSIIGIEGQIYILLDYTESLRFK